jgi:uncharacterized cupin superfamily protein
MRTLTQHLVSAREIAQAPELVTQHQFNANAIRHSKNLGDTAGMQRIGVHLVRIETGHDSTTHHYHDADEEFIYILSGRGIARIGADSIEVGAGDFMGFPAPSPAHCLHNPFEEDLVYLMGGERWAVDVVHYPDLGRSMIKANGQRMWTETDNFQSLPPRR